MLDPYSTVLPHVWQGGWTGATTSWMLSVPDILLSEHMFPDPQRTSPRLVPSCYGWGN